MTLKNLVLSFEQRNLTHSYTISIINYCKKKIYTAACAYILDNKQNRMNL